MVKIIFIVLFFVGSTSMVFAQGYLSLPDSVSGVLMQFLIDINDAGAPESYDEVDDFNVFAGDNLNVRDLLADQDLGPIVRKTPFRDRPDIRAILNGNGTGTAIPQYAIYAIRGNQWPSGEHVVIKHGDEYIIIPMYVNSGGGTTCMSYMNVLPKLTDYFQNYPDAPRILMPIYNEMIIKIWNDNLNIPME